MAANLTTALGRVLSVGLYAIGYNQGMSANQPDQLLVNPPVWNGDLDDDCTANWAGPMLRVEWMQDDLWWWAVYDPQIDNQVTTSDRKEKPCRSGDDVRREANGAARAYLKSDSFGG